MMLTLSFSTIFIIVFVAFAIGMFFGGIIAHQGKNQNESKRTHKIVMEISDEEYERLTNPKLDLEVKKRPDFPNLDILKDRKLDEQFLIEKKKPDVPKLDIVRDIKVAERFPSDKKLRETLKLNNPEGFKTQNDLNTDVFLKNKKKKQMGR